MALSQISPQTRSVASLGYDQSPLYLQRLGFNGSEAVALDKKSPLKVARGRQQLPSTSFDAKECSPTGGVRWEDVIDICSLILLDFRVTTRPLAGGNTVAV